MTRSVWFIAGAGAGVYAATRARRVLEAFTPEGLADRLAGLTLGAHLFSAEVRAGMADKEHDVRTRLGVALPGPEQHRTHALPSAPGDHAPDPHDQPHDQDREAHH